MPKRLLRSVIDFTRGDISHEHLVRNFIKLKTSVDAENITFSRPEDKAIYQYCDNFFTNFGELPSDGTLLDYFKGTENLDAQERIKDIAVEAPYIRANFSNVLRDLQKKQVDSVGMALLQKAADIMSSGVKQKDGTILQGFEAAYEHILAEGQKLVIFNETFQTHGDIREEGQEVVREVLHAKANQSDALGVLSGIDEIDTVIKGAKRGDLWVHAGFPSEGKTLTAYNFCYNAMTRYKTNVVFVSLEMPREQIRRNVYTLHSHHPKFTNMGFKPITYDAIQHGTLTDAELKFFLDYVVPDFESNPDYCTFELLKPAKSWSVADLRAQLEMLHKDLDVGLVVIDHGQWLRKSSDTPFNRQYTEELNQIVQDTKLLATQFNNGEGVPVMLLWQINREGKALANRNEGVYEASALTHANNLEKAADVITATYLNKELRDQRRIKFSCIKVRDGGWFEPFEAHVNFESRRLLSVKQTDHSIVSVDHDQLKDLGVVL